MKDESSTSTRVGVKDDQQLRYNDIEDGDSWQRNILEYFMFDQIVMKGRAAFERRKGVCPISRPDLMRQRRQLAV